jgi:hypothetical protein
MWVSFLFNILILLSALFVGWFLAWLCKDEIIFRKWFYIMFYFFIIITLLLVFLDRPFYEIFTGIYVIILVVVAILKSKNKVFIKSKK